MIIVMKPKAADKNIKAVTQYIEANGLTAHRRQIEGFSGLLHVF